MIVICYFVVRIKFSMVVIFNLDVFADKKSSVLLP